MEPPLPPLRDYSETELLALPADSRLLFADNVHRGVLTCDSTPPINRRSRVLQPTDAYTPGQLQSALLRVRALRCISHGLSAFSLYPTTDYQYNVNRFLWRAANDFYFDAREASNLFHRNVFIICMPAPLFDFLTSVSWEQLEVTVIFVLTILAQGNRGMRILHDELAPVMADKLSRFANIPDPGSVCDPNAFRLMLDLVMDRIVCMGPWVVPTTLCYLSAIDMTDLLAHRYQRPIFSTPEKFELVHTMMWNIYRDWQTYRHVLVKNGGRSRLEALELMARTISMGAQSLVDEGLRTLYQLAHETHDRTLIDPPHGSPTCNSAPLHAPRRKNFLSLLPTDIIVGKLMPKVCDVYANDDRYRRRSPATNALPEQLPDLLSPVTVPFSLKSWVLEDHFLHQMYHSADWDDDDEEMQDVNENHAQPQPAETPAPVVAPNPILTGSSGNPAAGGSMPSSNIVPLGAEDGLAAANDNISEQIGDNVDGLDHVEEGNRGGEHAQGLGNIATRMAQSSRALRRRLNERGSFERISGAASGAADEPPPQETG